MSWTMIIGFLAKFSLSLAISANKRARKHPTCPGPQCDHWPCPGASFSLLNWSKTPSWARERRILHLVSFLFCILRFLLLHSRLLLSRREDRDRRSKRFLITSELVEARGCEKAVYLNTMIMNLCSFLNFDCSTELFFVYQPTQIMNSLTLSFSPGIYRASWCSQSCN